VRKFKVEDCLEKEIFEEITRIRIENPEIIKEEAFRRRRRSKLTKDGKLTILAADHPGRMVTKAGENELAMGNRYEYLGRIIRVLTLDDWDGIMGTTDIIEELFILNHIFKKRSRKSFLDNKIMIGCMNRGGLKGTVFEMDDRFTSFTAERIRNLRLDGAKLMFRLNPQEKKCGKTIEYCARAIRELNQYDIPIFLEALAVDENYKTIKKADKLIKVISVATALGDSSRNIWLKIPYCENFKKVALATTCPILMLGGSVKESPEPILKEFQKGMRSGKNVRGALVGRNVLFPGNLDPREIAKKVYKIVHGEKK